MPSLFRNHFAVLQYAPTNLPFSVGGTTQSGLHPGEEMNNQDAAGLFVGESTIIGVVSDGCGGASPLGKNVTSMNEAGAQLSCLMAVHTLQILLKYVSLDEPNDFLQEFNRRFLWQLSHLSRLTGRSRPMRRHLLFEFFMSTVLGFAVTAKHFIVFGAGDGIIGINGDIRTREDFTGQYPANDVIKRMKRKKNQDPSTITCVRAGKTKDLENITIGTDGLYDFLELTGDPIGEINKSTASTHNNGPGYDPLFFREFRGRVSAALQGSRPHLFERAHDDRTLIVLRRTTNGATDQTNRKDPL